MIKNNHFFSHDWLPAGFLALDAVALAHLEGIGNVRNPQTQQRAGMGEDTDWLNTEVEKRCGLQRYPELGIAIQPVRGVMCAGAGKIGEYCGLFNTDRIGRACATVAADAGIKVLILDFDTPGGYTSGVEEAAAAVEALPTMRKGLNVIGYTARLCASAGEWVCAACQENYAAPSATRGSVGVMAAITDSSRAWREQGLDRYLATDGKYKAMGLPGVPVTDDQKAYLLAGVMETSASFKGYLTSRRKIQDYAMQGQTFTARRAPVGFCDGTEFRDLEELMAVIAGAKL